MGINVVTLDQALDMAALKLTDASGMKSPDWSKAPISGDGSNHAGAPVPQSAQDVGDEPAGSGEFQHPPDNRLYGGHDQVCAMALRRLRFARGTN